MSRLCLCPKRNKDKSLLWLKIISKMSKPSENWEFTQTQLKSPASSVGWIWFWQAKAFQPLSPSPLSHSPSLVVIKFSVYRFNVSWQAQRQAELRREEPSVSRVAVKHRSEEHRRAYLCNTNALPDQLWHIKQTTSIPFKTARVFGLLKDARSLMDYTQNTTTLDLQNCSWRKYQF